MAFGKSLGMEPEEFDEDEGANQLKTVKMNKVKINEDFEGKIKFD